MESVARADDEEHLLQAANDEVERFIAENCHSGSVSQKADIESRLRSFIAAAVASRGPNAHPNPNAPDGAEGFARFAVVTSGGTVAPLEQQEIRHVTNLSTGQRGSTSAEHLLRQGYFVIFLHKSGSLLPFARHFQTGRFLDKCTVVGKEQDGSAGLLLGDPALVEATREYQQYCIAGSPTQQLLFIPFHTVADYQLCMKTSLETLRDELAPHDAMKRVLVYLVAAVADFYVPWKDLPKDKIDSRPDLDDMTLYFRKVPKALARGLVGRKWGPGAFVVTFKLETDETRVSEKVVKHINAFSNIRMVAANLLQSYRQEVRLYDVRRPNDPVAVQRPTTGRCELEEPLVAEVVRGHREYLAGSW
jgi:phosphopantothenate-cysteine ligase